MQQKKIKKDQIMIWHAMKRFKQRFKKSVSEEYVRSVAKRIRHHENCKYIGRITNTKTVWKIYADQIISKDFIVIYNSTQKKISTVFPEEFLDEWAFHD